MLTIQINYGSKVIIYFFIIKTINHQKLAVLPETRYLYAVFNAKEGGNMETIPMKRKRTKVKQAFSAGLCDETRMHGHPAEWKEDESVCMTQKTAYFVYHQL